MRRERDGEAEQLRDLGHVLMRADLVRRDVLEHEAGVRSGLQRPPGAGHARLGVDDDAVGVDRVADGAEREQRRGRVAPRVRDQATGHVDELGQPVDPLAELRGARVREPVPLVVEPGVL